MPIFGETNSDDDDKNPIGVIEVQPSLYTLVLSAYITLTLSQLINKQDLGFFTSIDEDMMKIFLDIAGPILQNSQLFQRSVGAEIDELTGYRVCVRCKLFFLLMFCP